MPGNRRDGFALSVGGLVFLAGLALIGATFWQAYDLFTKAPQINLGIAPGKPIDFNVVGLNFVRLIVKILLLVVMAVIGSLFATKGVKMYSSAPESFSKPDRSEQGPEEGRPTATAKDV
ncbi:MAG: hypothetical protein JST30_01320 [Armatimonadetes bacterium]|nr:hypothetical protein [Armatimonadota bacterium]